jgi:hypothetical protein
MLPKVDPTARALKILVVGKGVVRACRHAGESGCRQH